MTKTIDTWRTFLARNVPQWFSLNEVIMMLERMDVSMCALKSFYAFDPAFRLNVSPYASGCPLRLDIRILEDHHDQLIRHQEQISVSSKRLRSTLLDEICEKHAVNLMLLEKIAKTYGQETLLMSEPLRLFALRSITEVESNTGAKAYTCCWERYTHGNMPVLYVMLFDFNNDGEPILQKDIDQLSFILRQETTQLIKLDHLGQYIDHAIASISPVWIGRIVFGPVFISNVTQDDHELQQSVNRLGTKDRFVTASRLIVEHVVSERSTDVRNLRDINGKSHQTIQKFAVKETDDECVIRGVSGVQKFLFAPHDVIALLGEKFQREIGHQIIRNMG